MASRLLALSAFRRRRNRDIAALVLSFFVTAFWFHRLMAHLGSAVLYAPNDESYSIRLYWAAAHFHANPFTLHRDILNGWPEGLPIPTAVEWANFLLPATIWVLHYPFGIAAAENIYLLGGFVLTAFSIYLLLDRLGFHPAAAAYAAYAATFSPWMFERAGAGHHGYMQAWVFVVQIGALLYVHRRRTVVGAVAAGVALAVSFYESSYYGLLGAVLFGVFWIVDFVRRKSWQDRLWSFTLLDVAVVAAFVAFVPVFVAWAGDRAAVAGGVSNGLIEVQQGGASLASYALPGTRNPFLGGITTHFYPDADATWSESTLYVGWSVVVLAVAGAVLVLRRHRFTLRSETLRYFLVSTLVLAPVAFYWSLKRETTILGVTFPTPSYVIGGITTFWRVYARFGELVMLSLAVLAAVAIHVALRAGRRFAVAAVVAAFALLLVEHAVSIPTTYSLKPQPWAVWLRHQPFGSVANYPMPTDKRAALVLLAQSYYDQTYDHQPQFMLFGSGYGDTREDAIRILARYVTDPLTPGILKAEQVKYVLLHDDVYRAQGETPPPIPAGMHLVARLPDHVRALELDADVQPADLSSVLQQNAASIALVEGLPVPTATPKDVTPIPGGFAVDPSGELDLSWKDTAALAYVQFLVHAHADGGARTLQLTDGAGNVVAAASVGTGDTQLTLGPVPVSGLSARFGVRSAPAGRIAVTALQVQPVANVTKTIRAIH